MDNETIYEWVLAKVAEGKLYNKQTQQFTFPHDEIGKDPVLRCVIGRIFYRQLSKAIVAAHPIKTDASPQNRAALAYQNLVGDAAQPGRKESDDWDMLVDLFDRANKEGIPEELFYDVNAWQNLEPPAEPELAPIARKVFHAASGTGGVFKPTAQSDSSMVKRLVDKYKENYRYLAAYYIVGENLMSEAAKLTSEVAACIKRRGIAIDREAAW